MLKIIRRTHPLINIINNSLVDLQARSNLSYRWNYGWLLGICLIIQILTALILSIHYNADVISAFNRLRHICRDINYRWVLRISHANGASVFFICVNLHVGRFYLS